MKKEKEVVLFVDSHFLNNSSGINTFIKNLIFAIDKINSIQNIYKYNINLLSDDREKLVWFKNMIKECHLETDVIYHDIDCKTIYKDDPINVLKVEKHLEYSFYKFMPKICDTTKRYIFIANSYNTTKILYENLYSIFDSMCYPELYSYTHIGDIFDMDKKIVHDYNEDEVVKYIDLFSNEEVKKHIKILTQTNCMKDQLIKITNNTNIEVVPEPLFIDMSQLIIEDFKTDDVLIIAGNYKRKRYDKMIKLLKLVDKPFKILVGKKKLSYDLDELILQNEITQPYEILEDLDNELIINHIMMSKMLLHIADIEVCPYSVLESASFIPVIVDNNNIWSQSLKDIVYLINTEDEELFKHTINEIYNNKLNTKFNLNDYQNEFINKWISILEK